MSYVTHNFLICPHFFLFNIAFTHLLLKKLNTTWLFCGCSLVCLYPSTIHVFFLSPMMQYYTFCPVTQNLLVWFTVFFILTQIIKYSIRRHPCIQELIFLLFCFERQVYSLSHVIINLDLFLHMWWSYRARTYEGGYVAEYREKQGDSAAGTTPEQPWMRKGVPTEERPPRLTVEGLKPNTLYEVSLASVSCFLIIRECWRALDSLYNKKK